MIKKLTILAASLTTFVLTSNFANAGLLDWANKGSENVHPLINDSSDWSVGNLYDGVRNFDLNKSQSESQEKQVNVTSDKTIPPASKKAITKTPTATTATTTILVLATGYSSTVDQTDDSPFITASGTLVRDGIVATNFLPMGTTIKIPELYGDKIFVVEDRMNKRYHYNIDIWFPERELAKVFGVKRVRIEILAKL